MNDPCTAFNYGDPFADISLDGDRDPLLVYALLLAATPRVVAIGGAIATTIGILALVVLLL